MEIERVQCLVRLNQNGKTNLMTILKAGPSAIPVTEIPILRAINDIGDGMNADECSIHHAMTVGVIETSKQAEYERLRMLYGRDRVEAQYPQGRMMPMTLADCELPADCLAPKPKPVVEEVIEENDGYDAKALRALLKDNDVKVPAGNLSIEDLVAMCEENGLLEGA